VYHTRPGRIGFQGPRMRPGPHPPGPPFYPGGSPVIDMSQFSSPFDASMASSRYASPYDEAPPLMGFGYY
jgi:hypothetical protein